jgi:DNA polymerase-3 subunit epsilon
MARFLRNLFYRVSLGNPAYRFLFQPGPPDEVVVIDSETTGLNPARRT